MGAFNADPHAGNILLDEASETLALIDYGQLVHISEKDRVAFVTAGAKNRTAEGVCCRQLRRRSDCCKPACLVAPAWWLLSDGPYFPI